MAELAAPLLRPGDPGAGPAPGVPNQCAHGGGSRYLVAANGAISAQGISWNGCGSRSFTTATPYSRLQQRSLNFPFESGNFLFSIETAAFRGSTNLSNDLPPHLLASFSRVAPPRSPRWTRARVSFRDLSIAIEKLRQLASGAGVALVSASTQRTWHMAS